MNRRYVLLVSSLPWLPNFERARRLPISRERLAERLRLLDPRDAVVVEQAEALLEWQRQPPERSDAELVRRGEQLVAHAPNTVLREMVSHRMGLRTVMAALRRRRLGRRPAAGETWGYGPWVGRMERHWNAPDLGLGVVLPWVPRARALLEAGEMAELQRLLMGLVWAHLDALEQQTRFDLSAVLVYLFKWEILERWLSQDAAAARARLEALARAAADAAGAPP